MGVDKATLPFGNQTLLERIYSVCASVCDEVVVAAPDFGGTGLEIPHDAIRLNDPGEGPLVAISHGLRRAGTQERVFVTGCDTPLLRTSLVALLFERAMGHKGAIAEFQGRRQPLCAVYSGELAADVVELVNRGERKALAPAKLPGIVTVFEDELQRVDHDLRSFRGCNTIEEYLGLLRFAGYPIPYEFLQSAGVRVPGQS